MGSESGVDALPFPIEVAPLGAFGTVDTVIGWLNGRQDEFRFHRPPADSRTLADALKGGIPATPDDLWNLLWELRRNVRRHQPYIIAVMETPLRSSKGGNQLGAAYHVADGLAVVSLPDWKAMGNHNQKGKQKSSRIGMLAYYLIRLTIRLLCPEVREHQEEPACVFHARQSEKDLLDDVWSLVLCTRCVEAISQDVAESAVRALRHLLEDLKPAAFQLTRRVWIAYSQKGSDVADELYSHLSKREAHGHRLEPKYLEHAFSLSTSELESAARAVKQHDYAVLVLTADELTESSTDELVESRTDGRPSDDAVFSLGFFMGTLGSHRTFMAHEEDRVLGLPKYVQGIGTAKYTRQKDGVSVVEAALSIQKAIERDLQQ